MQDHAVYQLHSIAIEKPWGSTTLQQKKPSLKNTKITENSLLGELVLVSTLEIFPTKISPIHSNTPHILFSSYWNKYGSLRMKSLSKNNIFDDFPFMLKILDVKKPLSVQVHPSTEQLKKIFNINDSGKSETWVILDAKPNANIYLGLRPDKKIAELWSLIETNPVNLQNKILDLLQPIQPLPKDIFSIKPGTIHATNGEILFYEIQENSNHTYRIYDFNRKRQLHLDDAKKVIDTNKIQKNSVSSPPSNTPFTLEFNYLNKAFSKIIQTSFSIVTFLNEQSITLYFENKPISVQWGDSFLLWKGASIEYTPSQDSQNKQEYCIFASSSKNNTKIDNSIIKYLYKKLHLFFYSNSQKF